MKEHSTTLFWGAVIFAAAAMFAGQIFLLNQFGSRRETSLSMIGNSPVLASQEPRSPFDRDNVAETRLGEVIANLSAAEEFTEMVQYPSDPAAPVLLGDHSVAGIERENTETSKPERPHVPDPLPTPENATPILGTPDAQDEAARAIIEQELPNVSAEEQEVWQQELKGMSRQMMREVLRLRRTIGSQQTHRIHETPAISRRPVVHQDPNALHQHNRQKPHVAGPLSLSLEDKTALLSLTPFDSHDDTLDRLQPTLAAIRLARNVILNNMANANTFGFKRSIVRFEDLPYHHVRMPGHPDLQGKWTSVGIAIGLGAQVTGTQLDFSQGRLRQTGQSLDLAIIGDGFFQIQNGTEVLYTRAGHFTLNADGEIVLGSAERGRLLEPAITVPNDTVNVTISGDGTVTVLQAGQTTGTQIGQIQTARFTNPQGLVQRGENLYAQTDASGPPLLGSPEVEGRGSLRQGFLEASNVSLDIELAEWGRLQRQRTALARLHGTRSPHMPPEATGIVTGRRTQPKTAKRLETAPHQ